MRLVITSGLVVLCSGRHMIEETVKSCTALHCLTSGRLERHTVTYPLHKESDTKYRQKTQLSGSHECVKMFLLTLCLFTYNFGILLNVVF